MTRVIRYITPFNIPNVANYSALPLPGTVAGKYYYCIASQGTKYIGVLWGGSYYPNGLYYSNGVSWVYQDMPFQASQPTVDAGLNNDEFVTPLTLTNSAQLAAKINTTDTRVVKDSFKVFFTGNGVAISINTNAIIPAVANGGTVTSFYIESDAVGSIDIDMLKNGVSMVGAGTKLDLVAASSDNGNTVGWTTLDFLPNDKIEFKVLSSLTIGKCWLVVKYDKTS